MSLEFNEATHRYTLDGRPLPSVTQVIEEFLPFGLDNEAVRQAAHFGQAVHKATEFRDRGIDADIDPQIEPWLVGWEKWKAEWLPKQRGTVIADIKTGTFSKKWFYQLGGYYGLWMERPRTPKEKPLIEWRACAGTEVSSSGYAGTVDRVYGPKRVSDIHRVILVAVQLFGNGEYRAHQSGNIPMVDYNYFVSMCNTWKILKEHKRLKQEYWNEYD